ncbi:MAG: YciI family protein [Chlorobi bacterium]|nr:YciI family protein [Chlorobiota bacterium]MCI0714938.1 YciI family protein [Chlorobiota bacterium]
MQNNKLQFLYMIKPFKENFSESMNEEESKIMSSHFEYLKTLLESKKLVLAGPETSGKFGLVVFEAESEDEAKSLMNNDPAVKSGIVSAELFPYRVSLLKS